MTSRSSFVRAAFVPALLAIAAGACEHSKTSNPLSPLIAGPIEGVTITVPVLLEPEPGRKFKPDQQPLTLLIENPESNSPRPFHLRIEMATDAQLTGTVVAREGLEPGPNGRTSFRLPDALPAGRIYYWRVRAEDGANSSNYSTTRSFEVLEPVVIGAPRPTSPVAGARVASRQPDLVVANATVSGPHLPLKYFFEVATDAAFGTRVAFEERSPGALETTLTMPHTLPFDTLHYWRVRVSDSEVTGAWSATESFRTPLAPTAPPPGGGGTPGTPGNCALSDGNAIVQCIAAKYPSYLAAGVSLHQRETNMAFLRDRVIEAGICGGLDLAWNLKRGVGPHSIDALAWRVGGRDEVVDIGAGFDDTSTELRLQWIIVGGQPGYDGYSPRPNCSGS